MLQRFDISATGRFLGPMSRSSPASPSASRLVSLLRELAIAEGKSSPRGFADRLAELIDLSDSIALSDQLRSLKRMRFQAQHADAHAIKRDFLQARAAMTEALLKKFIPEAGSASGGPPPAAATLEAYQRFYTLQQSEMELQVHKMRLHLREALSGVSPALAQLVSLDRLLADTLSLQSRKLFAVIPKLLARHYDALRGQCDPVMDDWRSQFVNDMQRLLLAELDLRLQPAVGLIEALDEEAQTSS